MKYGPGRKVEPESFNMGMNLDNNHAEVSHNPALERNESRGPEIVNRIVTTIVPDTQIKIMYVSCLMLNDPDRDGKPAVSYSLPYFIIRSQK